MSGLLNSKPSPEQLAEAWNHASQVWLDRFEELAVRQAQSLNGVLLRGARPVPVGLSAGGTTRPATSDGSLVGFALRETTGAASATVELREQDPAGALLVPITLTAGSSVREWFAPGGVNFSNGLYVVVVSGSVDGSVFLRAGDA